jgi:hypothetical protein
VRAATIPRRPGMPVLLPFLRCVSSRHYGTLAANAFIAAWTGQVEIIAPLALN